VFLSVLLFCQTDFVRPQYNSTLSLRKT